MHELDDRELLRAFTEENSEEAFAQLVTRHVDKVYSVALRHTRNPHQAEEITQSVFVLLARKARGFSHGVVVSGWLYHTARLAALTFLRTEIRRSRRHQEAHMHTGPTQAEDDTWSQLAPLLDQAMGQLNETDRHAVVLRFFDGRSLSDVGAALNATEEAARKRVNRALEKLRLFFTGRGVAVSATALAAMISTNSVQAAPAALAKTVCVAALAQGTAAGGLLTALAKSVFKPVFVSSAGLFASVSGSLFYVLKAEIENTRSLRERQFVLRMICLRFGAALLMVAVALGAMLLPVMKQPGAVEIGFAALCFCGAVESATRMIYFHRRRRQIQIEDGTWKPSEAPAGAAPLGLLASVPEKASTSDAHMRKAAFFSLVTCAIVTVSLIGRYGGGGHWLATLLILLWACFAVYRIATRMEWSRLVASTRHITPVKSIIYFGILTLLLFDLSWARGRFPQSTQLAIEFNLATILAYAGLVSVFARFHPLPGTPDETQ